MPLLVLIVIMALALMAGALFMIVLEKREIEEYWRHYGQINEQENRETDEIRRALNEERQRCVQQQEAFFDRYTQAMEKLVAFGRYELDAGERALKMQKLIDDRVKERTVTVVVDQQGRVIQSSAKPQPPAGEQPPDPNVTTSTILDEVMEAEREASRIIKEEIEWEKRDSFIPEQPPHETVM